ncbi:ArsR/SmtB family transcription factor [Cryobacterium tepidiphilum]|uniref:Transcriptional regulator n=1 Tax=Cryobacterium tepidiphilum TaxID=2486026 RepID=A0A3M8L0Z5_9MICO|nr:DUF5937 family protein [Cryobacterium tepidiphilum]RNE59026.1 transcriptional regulator [Cryobacterium tepidiphilum]
MVIALKLSQARRLDVVAGVSPLAELMACLHVMAEPDHHPESRGWADKMTSQLSDSLRTDLFRFAPLWARYRMRLFYPTSRRLGRPIDDELAELVDMDDDIFLPLAANAIRGRVVDFRSAEDVLTDRSWVTECQQRSFNRGELASSLIADPRGFRAELASVLRECCTAFFDEEWGRTSARLEASARLVNENLQDGDLLSIVESLSKMASTRGSETTVFFDKLQSASGSVDENGLLLVPSLRGWPHVMVKMDRGLPIVIHYLAQEGFAEGAAQSQDEIRRRLLTLAEPGRWELCRHLIGESITTTELAVRTKLSEPAVSRHLRVMREAGLISSQRDGRQVFHRLHPSLILHLGQDVLSAIIR